MHCGESGVGYFSVLQHENHVCHVYLLQNNVIGRTLRKIDHLCLSYRHNIAAYVRKESDGVLLLLVNRSSPCLKMNLKVD